MRTDEMPVLDLAGTPRRRGRAHGESLRDKIGSNLAFMKEGLRKSHNVDADAAIEDFLSHTDFLPAMERWTPGLHDEIQGIAEGSGCELRDLLALNFTDELWCYGIKDKAREWKGPYNKCTCAAAFGQAGLPTLAGQNMDIPHWHDGQQVLLRIRHEDGLEALVFSSAGLIALNGINNRGVGVAVNAIFELDHASSGLPVACIIRGALERPGYREAVEFIESVPHASGQNYVIAGPDEVVSLECSAGKITRFHDIENPGRLWHANQALANDDCDRFRELIAGLPEARYSRGFANSQARVRAARERMSDATKPVTLDTLRQVFSSRDHPDFPVSYHYDVNAGILGFTAGCAIYEIPRLGPPVLHLSAGPPDITEFRTFRF